MKTVTDMELSTDPFCRCASVDSLCVSRPVTSQDKPFVIFCCCFVVLTWAVRRWGVVDIKNAH